VDPYLVKIDKLDKLELAKESDAPPIEEAPAPVAKEKKKKSKKKKVVG
jgi:hypothetical protein